jgi:hypothetical protein
MDGMQYVDICKQKSSSIYIATYKHMRDIQNLEYEEIAELRKVFLKIKKTEGMDGIKKFARNH